VWFAPPHGRRQIQSVQWSRSPSKVARGSVVLFCGGPEQWRGRIKFVLRARQFFEARHEAGKILGLHIVCHLRF
jgi:hypothetical protein